MYKRANDKLTVIVIVFMLFATIVFDKHMSHIIEQEKRQQARYNLEQVRHCLDVGLPIMTEVEAFHQCIGKSKTSPTGDVYVFNPHTLEGVYDTSVDTPTDKKLKFTKDSLGKVFRDWPSAQIAIDKIVLGKDSKYGDGVQYMFDDDWEWLEWIYYPEEYSKAFSVGTPYVIVQGIQRDEILGRYANVRMAILICIGLIVLLLLSSITVSHRRR